MYIKLSKIIRWMLKKCFWILLILTTILTISTLVYFNSIEDFRDLYFDYPEETYQELEFEAKKLAQKLEEIENPYSGTFETTLRTHFPSANVTLKIYGLGSKNSQVIIERGYTSAKQKIFWETCSIILIALVASVILLLIILCPLIFLFFCSCVITKLRTMRK